MLTEMPAVRGEGGIHAMRDAMSIAKTLVKVAEEGSAYEGWKTGVDEYQKEMLERGGKAVRLSRVAGDRSTVQQGGPRYAWNQPATVLPAVSVSLDSIPRMKA